MKNCEGCPFYDSSTAFRSDIYTGSDALATAVAKSPNGDSDYVGRISGHHPERDILCSIFRERLETANTALNSHIDKVQESCDGPILKRKYGFFGNVALVCSSDSTLKNYHMPAVET